MLGRYDSRIARSAAMAQEAMDAFDAIARKKTAATSDEPAFYWVMSPKELHEGAQRDSDALVGRYVISEGYAVNALGRVFYLVDKPEESQTNVYGMINNGVQCRLSGKRANEAGAPPLQQAARVKVWGKVSPIWRGAVAIEVRKFESC